jgi:CrcB protein
MLVLEIAIAGAVGAMLRSIVDTVVRQRSNETLPRGTLTINVTGSFVLGIVTGLALYHGLGADSRAVYGTGFCGGYTTFSTFAYQTVRLGEQRAYSGAWRNIAASLALPAAAAALGLALTAW